MTLIPWSSPGPLEKVETWVLRDHDCPGPDTSAVSQGTSALIAALAVIRDFGKPRRNLPLQPALHASCPWTTVEASLSKRQL